MLRLIAGHRQGAYARLLFTGLVVIGCSNVLGIADPTPKPADGGEAGAAPDASGPQPVAGSGGAPSAGEAGAGVSGGSGGNGGNGNSGASGALSGQGGMAGAPSGAGEGGEAGAPGDPCPLQNRCGGESGKVPQICDAGQWTTNMAESTGDCPVLCVDGRCVACKDGDTRCNDKESQKCVGGTWQDQTNCPSVCSDGACLTPPSCGGVSKHLCANSTSCCEAHVVPGGSFIRDYDGSPDFSQTTYTATLSPFIMDKYEVTVGRMQGFVSAYAGIQLKQGDGKGAHISEDPGWQDAYPLPATVSELKTDLGCPGATWTEQLNGDVNLPINCVTFYVAYAFCIWDGGRLPTEAEWNFAASGGDQQRVYPWLVPPDTVANVDAEAYVAQIDGPIDVGSKPGLGRWSQADLAGNLAEMTLDYYASPYPSTTCNDCLNNAPQPVRSMRGGAYIYDSDSVRVSARDNIAPDDKQSYVGFRCVRDIVSNPSN